MPGGGVFGVFFFLIVVLAGFSLGGKGGALHRFRCTDLCFLKCLKNFFLLLFVKQQRFLEYGCVSNYRNLLPLKIITPCVLQQ